MQTLVPWVVIARVVDQHSVKQDRTVLNLPPLTKVLRHTGEQLASPATPMTLHNPFITHPPLTQNPLNVMSLNINSPVGGVSGCKAHTCVLTGQMAKQ